MIGEEITDSMWRLHRRMENQPTKLGNGERPARFYRRGSHPIYPQLELRDMSCLLKSAFNTISVADLVDETEIAVNFGPDPRRVVRKRLLDAHRPRQDLIIDDDCFGCFQRGMLSVCDNGSHRLAHVKRPVVGQCWESDLSSTVFTRRIWIQARG
jgi:hypothetical protein